MVGGLLGMLAFLLAFTFSIASTQHELRKQNVLEEANAISTSYLRTDLFDIQYANELKRLFREYVDIRIKAANGDDINSAIDKSIKIHDLLWTQVLSAAKESHNTNTSLMIQSVNEVIDMHEKRVMGSLRNRIPGSVWIALVAIIALTMLTQGTQIGFSGKRRFIAVLAFAVLVTLVVDINRPEAGFISVDQQSMTNLQNIIDPITK